MRESTLPMAAWWRSDASSLAQEVWTRVDRLRSRRRRDNAYDLIHEAIYRGRPLAGAGEDFGGASYSYQKSAPANINVVRSKVSAISSRMSKHRPFPIISCEDAGWTEKRFATRTSSVLRSQLGRQSVERDRTLRVRDTIIRGTGVAHVVRTESNDVAVERVPRSEILYSPREAQYGAPRSLYRVRSYPLEVVLAKYPKKIWPKIEAAASRATYEDRGWYEWGDDWADDTYQVCVAEAWHLPSGYGAEDGRHVGVIRDAVLFDDKKWTRTRFPFSFLHWDPPIRGLFGMGLVEDLSGPQAKINDVSRDIQEALYYGAQLTVFSPRGSKVNKEHLRARHPKVIEYDGQIPTYLAPLPVSQQLFQYLDWLINWCDDASGLSRDFQSGKTQLGAGASGKALDTLDDIQSDRFAMFQLHDSLHMVDIGALVIDEARAIAAEVPKSEQPAWIAEHKWSKLDLDEGLYHLKLEPVNFLPGTRAGKMEAISELGTAGLISDPTDMLELMEEPDLARMNRKLLGPRHAIAKVLAGLADVDEDLYSLSPDSFFPIDAGLSAVRAELNDAWASNAGEDVLERFREWIRLATAKKKELAPAPSPGAAGMAPPEAMPPDMGMQPPPEAGGMPPEMLGAMPQGLPS